MDKFTRPETTLILSSSVDGRITSRDSDELDPNKNWKKKQGVRGILQQFFDFAVDKDIYVLTTGQAMARSGINIKTVSPQKINLKLIVIDQPPHLTPKGIIYLAKCIKKLFVVTDKKHPSLSLKHKPKNLTNITYPNEIDLKDLMHQLKTKYKINKITIQSAGVLNSHWIEMGLVDHLTVIIYPLLIGNSGTPVLVNQEPLKIRPLRLVTSRIFNNNYLFLRYDVVND